VGDRSFLVKGAIAFFLHPQKSTIVRSEGGWIFVKLLVFSLCPPVAIFEEGTLARGKRQKGKGLTGFTATSLRTSGSFLRGGSECFWGAIAVA